MLYLNYNKLKEVAKTMTREDFIDRISTTCDASTLNLPGCCPNTYNLPELSCDECSPDNINSCKRCWREALDTSQIEFKQPKSTKKSNKNEIFIAKTPSFLRVARREDVQVSTSSDVTVTHVVQPYTKVVEILNEHNDIVGVDVINECGESITCYYNPLTGITKVDFIGKDGRNYTGVAQCAETDKFNSQIGYDIAYARAMINYYKNNIAKYME